MPARSIELVVSITLLAVFAPLILFLAIILLISGSGPIIVKREYLGKHFQIIEILEIHQKTPSHPSQATPGRYVGITIAKCLFKSQIHKLPQLLNVIHGNMCLVGPKPLRLSELTDMQPQVLELHRRLKPGVFSPQDNAHSKTLTTNYVR